MMTETEVILKFAYKMRDAGSLTSDVDIELPGGAWEGSRDRGNGGDIRTNLMSPIEAKGEFSEAKKDYNKKGKNVGIQNYLYAVKGRSELAKQKLFWKKDTSAKHVIVYVEKEDDFVLLASENHEKIRKLLGEGIEIFR